MTLTQDDEQLLGQFRQWLTETAQEAAETDADAGDDQDFPTVGLYDLCESFTALRQEVKLQTKGTRGLQDLAQSLINEMQTAVEQFRSVTPREAGAARDAGRPFAESLADLCESLERGRLALERSCERMMAEAARDAELIDTELAALPAWRRWFCRPLAQTLRTQLAERTEQSQRPVLDSLLTGFGLIQQRLDRALQAHGLQRIQCLGRPPDVNRMTVVEMVESSSHAAGTVIEEVRPGFVWEGDVLRYAEVKVAR